MTATETAAELVKEWHETYFGMKIPDHVLGELTRRIAFAISEKRWEEFHPTDAEMEAARRFAREKPSTSYIQRRMMIGYNLASEIMERLEAEGLVSACNSVGKREVLGESIAPVTGPPDDYTDELRAAAFKLFGDRAVNT